MKPQILAVKPALAGNNATATTSRMVKLMEGRCWAYGGAFCLSVPIASSLECGFFPDPVLAFFSRDREGATFTEQDGRLLMKHESLEISTPIVAAQCIPVLQTIGAKVPVTEQFRHLNIVANLCKNTTTDWRQGAWFKDGMIFAMMGQSLCFSTDGLTHSHEMFGLPSDSTQALARIKSPLTHFVMDRQSVQFEFEDGTWLASRILEGLEPPDFMKVFDVPETTPIKFNPEVVKEILAFKLHGEEDGVSMDMIWHGKDGSLSFRAPDGTEGVFEYAYEDHGKEFRIKGESLRVVLALEPEELELANSLLGFGDGFAVAGALTRIN